MKLDARHFPAVAFAAGGWVLFATGDAAAQAARPSPPAAGQTEASFETARVAFEKLPEPERKAIQEALVWTGDHVGVTTGGFGRRTF